MPFLAALSAPNLSARHEPDLVHAELALDGEEREHDPRRAGGFFHDERELVVLNARGNRDVRLAEVFDVRLRGPADLDVEIERSPRLAELERGSKTERVGLLVGEQRGVRDVDGPPELEEIVRARAHHAVRERHRAVVEVPILSPVLEVAVRVEGVVRGSLVGKSQALAVERLTAVRSTA